MKQSQYSSLQQSEQFSTQSTIQHLPSFPGGTGVGVSDIQLTNSKSSNSQIQMKNEHRSQVDVNRQRDTESPQKQSEHKGKEIFDSVSKSQQYQNVDGDETGTSLSKKPQFQFVCMEPTKDSRPHQVKMHSIANKDNKQAQIIEPTTLQRILKLQTQQKVAHYGHSGSTGYGRHHHQSTIHESSNKDQLKRGRQLHYFQDIEKIGICGIPSLWMQREELSQKGHLFRDQADEGERLELMLRILQSHKKYENDKYFGGSLFKRGNQSQGTMTLGSGALQNQSSGSSNQIQIHCGVSSASGEYVWFTTENLARLKISAQNPDIGESHLQLLPQIRGYEHSDSLSFKILQAEAKLVRLVLESHSFVHTDQNDWNILWTCTSSLQRQYLYENLNEFQKINHFISASELTRKDRLCYNVGKMQLKFGRDHFDFLPETYILPDEHGEFQKSFNFRKEKQTEEGMEEEQKNLWIIKPSSSSQGKGIYMVDKLSEVPQNEQLVISKYIDNPLLINGLKFDLRLYVLVTNFDPLKIYVYNEGLVRFASEPYNLESIKSNVYAHLTNYSINKKSENFVQNQSLAERDFGNKWSLSALQTHLERLGIDTKLMWSRIYDSITKSIISVENQVVSSIKKVQNSSGSSIKNNCFDLFGFDIILDSELKPWILEVNLSPSLAFDSPLDYHIKSNLIIDALNLVGIRRFNRKKEAMGKHLPNSGAKSKQSMVSQQSQPLAQAQSAQHNKGSEQKRRHNALSANSGNVQSQSKLEALVQQQQEAKSQGICGSNIDVSHMEKLSKISAKHRELLREHLEEFCMMRHYVNPVTGNGNLTAVQGNNKKKTNFTRIFPAPGSNQYDMYFQSESQQTTIQSQQPSSSQAKQWNKVLYRYLYDKSSELNEIINQITKQQRTLIENNRRTSQVRLNMQQELSRGGTEEPSSGEQSPSKKEVVLTTPPSDDPGKGQHVTEMNLGPGSPVRKRTDGASYETMSSLNAVFDPAQHATQYSKIKLHQLEVRSQSSIQNKKGSTIASEQEDQDKRLTIAQSSTLKTIDTSGGSSPLHSNKETMHNRGIAAVQLTQSRDQTIQNSLTGQSNDLAAISHQSGVSRQSQNRVSLAQDSVMAEKQQACVDSKYHSATMSVLKTTATDKPKQFTNTLNPDANVGVAAHKALQNLVTSGGVSRALDFGESSKELQGPQVEQNRIVVTGDDILIEYVNRITLVSKYCQQQHIEISNSVQKRLEQFIAHKIWQPKEERKQSPSQQFQGSHNAITGPSQNVWQKMESRFTEMGDRKRRLFIKKYQHSNYDSNKKPEGQSIDHIDKLFKVQEKQKSDIVKDFSSAELELMLMQSNKNNPIEVVTLLLTLNQPSSNEKHGGVLTQIEYEYSRMNRQPSNLARNGVAAGQTIVKGNGNSQKHDDGHHDRLIAEQVEAMNLQTHKQNMFINKLRATDEQNSQEMMQPRTDGGKEGLGSFNKSIYGPKSTIQHAGILGVQGAQQIHNSGPGSSLTALKPQSSIHPKKVSLGDDSNFLNHKSNSKIKLQGTFDRSDIALQTGLALTHKNLPKINNNANASMLQNDHKKTTLPQIQNNAVGGAIQQPSTTGQTYLQSFEQFQASANAYLHHHQTLQNFLSTGDATDSQGNQFPDTRESSQSIGLKYRTNKISGGSNSETVQLSVHKDATNMHGGGSKYQYSQKQRQHGSNVTALNSSFQGSSSSTTGPSHNLVNVMKVLNDYQ